MRAAQALPAPGSTAQQTSRPAQQASALANAASSIQYESAPITFN